MWTPSSKKRKLKAVLDTNVWVSAMIWGGLPAEVISAAENKRICIITSEAIIEEINQTLAYPRLRRVYEDAGVNRQELIEAALRIGKLVEVKTKVNVVHEDPADNKFLECAFDGKADFLVTGDEHLLRIGHYKATRIVSVRQFLRILKEQNRPP
jgi:putative PIN family toxin of toxin-antitoxin system